MPIYKSPNFKFYMGYLIFMSKLSCQIGKVDSCTSKQAIQTRFVPSSSINTVTEKKPNKQNFNFQSICLSTKLIRQPAGRMPCLTQTSQNWCSWMSSSAQVTHISLVSHHRTVIPHRQVTMGSSSSLTAPALLSLEAAHRDQLGTLWTAAQPPLSQQSLSLGHTRH